MLRVYWLVDGAGRRRNTYCAAFGLFFSLSLSLLQPARKGTWEQGRGGFEGGLDKAAMGWDSWGISHFLTSALLSIGQTTAEVIWLQFLNDRACVARLLPGSSLSLVKNVLAQPAPSGRRTTSRVAEVVLSPAGCVEVGVYGGVSAAFLCLGNRTAALLFIIRGEEGEQKHKLYVEKQCQQC